MEINFEAMKEMKKEGYYKEPYIYFLQSYAIINGKKIIVGKWNMPEGSIIDFYKSTLNVLMDIPHKVKLAIKNEFRLDLNLFKQYKNIFVVKCIESEEYYNYYKNIVPYSLPKIGDIIFKQNNIDIFGGNDLKIILNNYYKNQYGIACFGTVYVNNKKIWDNLSLPDDLFSNKNTVKEYYKFYLERLEDIKYKEMLDSMTIDDFKKEIVQLLLDKNNHLSYLIKDLLNEKKLDYYEIMDECKTEMLKICDEDRLTSELCLIETGGAENGVYKMDKIWEIIIEKRLHKEFGWNLSKIVEYKQDYTRSYYM